MKKSNIRQIRQLRQFIREKYKMLTPVTVCLACLSYDVGKQKSIFLIVFYLALLLGISVAVIYGLAYGVVSKHLRKANIQVLLGDYIVWLGDTRKESEDYMNYNLNGSVKSLQQNLSAYLMLHESVCKTLEKQFQLNSCTYSKYIEVVLYAEDTIFALVQEYDARLKLILSLKGWNRLNREHALRVEALGKQIAKIISYLDSLALGLMDLNKVKSETLLEDLNRVLKQIPAYEREEVECRK